MSTIITIILLYAIIYTGWTHSNMIARWLKKIYFYYNVKNQGKKFISRCHEASVYACGVPGQIYYVCNKCLHSCEVDIKSEENI